VQEGSAVPDVERQSSIRLKAGDTYHIEATAILGYVSQVYPDEHIFALPLEAAFAFDQAFTTDVNGEFAATALLS
jgi:hypothetical protein